MKKIFILLFLSVFALTFLDAQAPPQALSFKATIFGSNGQPLILKPVHIRITIQLTDDPNDISPVYYEYFYTETSSFGQVDLQVGRGSDQGGLYPFEEIPWSADEYFLKIEVDSKLKGTYVLISLTQLLSVPYALYAGSAGIAPDQTLSLSDRELTISGEDGNTVAFTNWDIDATDDVTRTGDQTISGNKTFTGTTTVSDPINPTDAVTKAYVDLALNPMISGINWHRRTTGFGIAPGAKHTSFATCDAGEFIVGGGGLVDWETRPNTILILTSYPSDNTTWAVQFLNTHDTDWVTASAYIFIVCAEPYQN